MPFVNIRILKGHSQQRKDEMSRRITAAISEVAELPKEADLGGVRGCHRRRLVCRRSARERASEGARRGKPKT